MRTYTSSGITIQYPENLCLTGNRNIVSISGATTKTTFTIYGDTRDLIDGAGEFDLMPYFMAEFDDVSKNEKFEIPDLGLPLIKSINFDSEATFLNMDFSLLYGKNLFEDVRFQTLRAEYSPGVADWYDFYLLSANVGTINGVLTSFFAGYNSIDLSSYTGDVIIDFEDTFDDTFDETFTPGLSPIVIERVLCPENGLLLRWLDRWGIWQQKNFSKLNYIPKGTGNSFIWNWQTSDILYNGLQFAEKKQALNYDIQAQGVTTLEALRLSNLCSADFVHVYDFNAEIWLPVVVTTGEIPIPLNRNNHTISLNIQIQNEA